MTVLLTGGAGYIGSHVAVEMINAGFNVVIADNLSAGHKDVPERIKTVTGVSFPFFEIDICDKEAVRGIFDSFSVDAVVHAAGYKAVAESVSLPLKYYRNNTDGALTLLEVMAERGVKAFVFSSSATVYGIPDTVPIKETAHTGDCLNAYGRTKYIIEKILEDLCRSDPLFSAVPLRYFNPVGAHRSGLLGDDPIGVPNNLMPYILRVAAGRLPELNIFGNDYPTKDGTCIRDYIHVVDLAKGHTAAVDYAVKHSGYEVFNLGTGIGYSVLDMVRVFEKVTGRPLPYKFAPRREGDSAEYLADPSKAEKNLGWRAVLTIEDMCFDAQRYEGGKEQ